MSTLRGCFRQARFGADQRLSERPRVLAAIDQQVLTGAGDNSHVNALAGQRHRARFAQPRARAPDDGLSSGNSQIHTFLSFSVMPDGHLSV